jgi:hypothetical protein
LFKDAAFWFRARHHRWFSQGPSPDLPLSGA